MLDDDFFEKLPDDPILAGHNICEEVFNLYGSIPPEDDDKYYEKYLEAFGIFQAFSEAYSLNIKFPDLVNDKKENVALIFKFFSEIRDDLSAEVTKITVSNTKNKYLVKFGKAFSYIFSDGDYKRIQTLINELRENITGSNLFESNHKYRILKKLEKLQNELHKKVSSLDELWGLIGDAGVVLGKFGNDAKPLVDRIKEIAQITWRTQARAEELPSSSPLPKLDNTDGNEGV